VSIEALEELARAPSPAFRCVGAGRRENRRFYARLRHILRPPAAADDIAWAQRMLMAAAGDVVAFCRRHDGFVLYQDNLSETAGIEMLPIRQWPEATAEMRTWLDMLCAGDDPDRLGTGVAFATAPHSANYFVMPVEGPAAGKVFYAQHDDWYDAPFAEDFHAFLAHVARDPVTLLCDDLGCFARYSDGFTTTQWIPEVYHPDAALIGD
jgi:hypothetical protein